jgi:hypothetical protein
VQEAYIGNYFDSFYAVLTNSNWTDPVNGYAAWIDVDSWIDYHLINVFSRNTDALRLSAFLYKDEGGKIVMGPQWDFDRIAGSGGGEWRPWNPRAWMATNPHTAQLTNDFGTDYFNAGDPNVGGFANPWYSRLFTDPDFWQKWIDRYQDLRTDELTTNKLFYNIDYYASQLGEPALRDAAKYAADDAPRSGLVQPPDGWPDTSYSHTFPDVGTYQGEIDFMKEWIAERLEFMDTNFLDKPLFSSTGGLVSAGQSLTVTPAADLGTQLYYTLDGTDPRLSGGAISPAALSASGAVTFQVTTNVRVFARSWNAAHQNLTGSNNPPISSSWSGRTVGTFCTAIPPLRVTELMYNPPPPPAGDTNDPDNFEYIELQNISASPLPLQGFQLSGGIDFIFPNLTLSAGQYVLVVKNIASFQSRYGSGALIAGVYSKNLGNSGDHIVLEGPLVEPILDFNYNDTWYPATDGEGFSLVIRDPNAAVNTWGLKESWRPSAALNGSPGQADPAPPAISALLINEALVHTDLPERDTVEIFNPTATSVNVGGWMLTDDRHKPTKFRIPPGVTVPAGGFVTLDTNSLPGSGFALSSVGEDIYLFSADASTNLTGYAHGFSFGPSPNGVSFGRFVNSFGEEQFVLQSQNTLGTRNAYPRIGPLVISEIMYHPPDFPFAQDDSLDEFIELQNIASTNVPLYDVLASTNTWHLANAVDFDFPTNIVVAPGERLLAVSFDPQVYPATKAAFVAKYNVPASTRIFGPWSGKLDNSGESIELQCPDHPNVTATNVFTPYYLVEQIEYSDSPPWPTNADGGGASLQRVNSALFGNDAINWQAAPPTAGQTNAPPSNLDTDGDGLPDYWEMIYGLDPTDATGDNGAAGDPDHDGSSNLADFFGFSHVSVSNQVCVFQFNTVVGHTYSVETTTNLETINNWLPLTNGIAGSGAPVILNCPATQNQSFYRLNVTRDDN